MYISIISKALTIKVYFTVIILFSIFTFFLNSLLFLIVIEVTSLFFFNLYKY